MSDDRTFLERCVYEACVLEATACKAGNVHPQRAFVDLTYDDFVRSAAAVAPVLAGAETASLGDVIRNAIRATRAVVRTNTNLGMVLLLAPLAAVPLSISLREGIGPVLAATTIADAERVYEAIRLASPGGLGSASEQDVTQRPTVTLTEAMRLAADRDRVAEQYANGFATVLRARDEWLSDASRFAAEPERSIQHLQLELLAEKPDSLIVRKCGHAVGDEAMRRAREILRLGSLWSQAGERAYAEYDAWLRADGHRRNPGTTADLTAAALFTALRDRSLTPPEGFVPRR